MEKIKLRVSGSQIEVAERPAVITAGTVGLTAEFSFDSQWDGLAKTAVFKAGEKVIAGILEKNTHTVPWEVLAQPNLWLCIGIYGANADGSVVIPTLWAKASVIHTGTVPEGDPALEPTAPVWQEVLARLDGVTAEGVGAATRDEMDAVQGHLLSLQDAVDSHRENMGNPHGVTCEKIGAATEEYVDIMVSTKTSLEEVANEVQSALSVAGLTDHATSCNNPHGVTAEQIGAAPAGYGLGENTSMAENWNSQWNNGFYRESTNSPDNTMWYGITCCVEEGSVQTNIAFSRDVSNGLQEVRRYKVGNTFGQWEYVNPPMLEGVEYRTTERWNGKAVYTKLIHLSVDPDGIGSDKIDFGEVISGADTVVSAEYREMQSHYCNCSRSRELYLIDGGVHFSIYGVNLDSITEATLLLKYTKTT